MNKRIISILLVFLTTIVHAQKIVTAQKISFIDSLAENLYLNEDLVNANVGIAIYSHNDAKTIYSYNANKKLTPASNLKILTNYAALHYLDDSLDVFDYYEKQDTLFILPSADPTLLYRNFDASRVIDFFKNIKAKVIAINTIQWKEEKYPDGWIWEDYGNNFMVERTLMPIWGNIATFVFNTKNNKLEIKPSLFYKDFISIELDSDLLVSRNYVIKRDFLSNTFYTEETDGNTLFKFNEIPVITNNTDLTIKGLATLTQKKIILISREIHNINDYKVLHNTPTKWALKTMMTESNNYIAEHLLLMISKRILGYMDTKQAIELISKNLMSDLPYSNKWIDGSGLSRYNIISPNDMILVLNKTVEEFTWNAIAQTFSTANEGTLYGYYTNYKDQIFAKTGSMRNTLSLSGIFKTNNASYYTFSIIANGFTTNTTAIRRLYEKFISSLIEGLE